MKGIDVSEWQTGLDYTRIARQIDFVILREGYRQTRDKMFDTHVAGFRATRTPIKAVYHFLYCTDSFGAQKEAESCLRSIEQAGLSKDTYVFADFEYDTVEKAKQKGITLTPLECNLFTRTFCETVTKAGYPAGIYTNLDFYENWYDPSIFDTYSLWLAQYGVSAPSVPCLVWQYSETGHLDYFPENLDMDIWYEEESTLTTTEKAIQWMENLAKDDSHGYDQTYRWGERGDYDCSSAVITAWKTAGVPLTCTYTGNMYADMTKKGFKDVTASCNLSTGSGLKRGDVLLNHVHHVAMYCGSGQEVEASINEKGTATGGKPGDQTGREILVRSYRNYPWNAVLRYEAADEDEVVTTMFSVTQVQAGSRNDSVRLLQTLLKGLGYKDQNGVTLDIDSDFGSKTDYAVRSYQGRNGLVVDGVCGPATWGKLLQGLTA